MFNTCLRCGYAWLPRSGNPSRCPQCKSTRWNIEHVTHTCLRCGAQWNQRGNAVPRYCPTCHSSVWNEPKVEFICPRCGKSRILRANSRKSQCPYCDAYKDTSKEEIQQFSMPKPVDKLLRLWRDGNGHVLMYSKELGNVTLYDNGQLISTINLDSWLRAHRYNPENAITNYREEYMQKELGSLARHMLNDKEFYEDKANSIKTLYPVTDTTSKIMGLREAGMQPMAIALKLKISFSEVMDTLNNIPPMQAPAKLDLQDNLDSEKKSQYSNKNGGKA